MMKTAVMMATWARKALIMSCFMMLLSGVATTAHAITFVDSWNPNPNVNLSSSNRTYSYTHNILDNGFNPSTDTLTSASVALAFQDTGDADFSFFGFCISGCEEISVSLDGTSTGSFEVDTGVATFNVLSKLADGILNVVINWQDGDIRFDDSTLTAVATRSAAQVPEPASFILLGLGLLSTVWVARRQKNQQLD
jgi:hypothetical protein